MFIPDVTLHETRSLAEAAQLLQRYSPDARLLAGGTDLLVDLKSARMQTAHLISLNGVSGLRGVSADEHGLRIGALTTITELDRSPLVRERCPPILDATRQMAAPQVRNLATVGGNLASAVPCADLPPILMALDAHALIWSEEEERTVTLESFYIGPRQTILSPGEILTGVCVPYPPPSFGAAYARFALREGNAIAVAAVAAGLTLDAEGNGGDEPRRSFETITDARIVLGAVAPTPERAYLAENVLLGRPADEEAFAEAARAAMQAAAPISDVRGSAEFRRELVGVLTRRALCAARQRASRVGNAHPTCGEIT
jgi:carbon-monoxide dehydrogenase medium subunit